MSEYYDLNEIKEGLKKKIAVDNAFLEAWQKVTFPTKKDGKPFAVLSRNIEGATMSEMHFSLQKGENDLTVYTYSRGAGYVSDSIHMYDFVEYLTDKNKIAKKENYQPKQPFLNQVYTFDLEDIKNAVNERIEYFKNHIIELEKQLENADRVYYAFRDAYDKAIKTLQNETSEYSSRFLYHAVLDCVKDRYPYV